MSLLIAAIPAFLASLVEFVEALTIVLAIGLTRGWKASIAGAAAAGAILVAAVLAFGPAIARIDPAIFRSVVGSLLLFFGVRWIRKAILRYAGVIPMRDEDVQFTTKQAAFRLLPTGGGFDTAGAAISFKATLLEGLEVVFIVLALGAKGHRALEAASIGALAALAAVVALGFALRRPLAKVPENALKFSVGGMLCAFGMFWAGEGLGVTWPGDELALLYLLGGTALMSGFAIRWLRADTPHDEPPTSTDSSAPSLSGAPA